MYRVLITDNLSPAGLKILEDNPEIEVDVRSGLSPEEVREALKSADGIIIRSATKLTEEILQGQPRLKAIVRAGVGVDNIDRVAATREGIIVMNTPAGNTTSTAEQTIALMMALARNIGPAYATMKEGKWERKKLTGTQVAGKTLAVIGLGRIGLSVAQRAQGLEMKVIGYDPFMSAERAAEYGIELYKEVDEIVKHCDFLTVHTPLTDETRDLINAERIATMRPGVRIINCARGGIVNEDDLADALESGKVAGAACDVFTQEPPENRRLIDAPNMLATPHLGASTDEAQEMVALEAAEIITDFLTKNEIRHAINMIPVSGAEMADLKPHIELGHRLGLFLSQQTKGSLKNVQIQYRGEVAEKQTKLITSSFAAGLLSHSFEAEINIVNATVFAKDRGIDISESKSTEAGTLSTMISATVETEEGKFSAAGTIFGQDFLRLTKLDEFYLDGYLDGNLLIYRHHDVPGLIGYIGTVLGNHKVNIAHMALGRLQNQPGGEAIAVLNVDGEVPEEAIAEVSSHKDVSCVKLIKMPPATAPLSWLQ
ncbi:D-3-phosphoglycerate dehydrogenase [Gimesia panareensis]|uniref:D-3-phosphoglycerate dehydrogenase n=1 Tax=Gimesia panareensis TaxID=2527978 RepID=A0A517Q0S6_9PLAN|nr:phosphoglycerate dehydrogenase [Gimesia panareensis]QDT25186.1 D-3-phosphoglycerate dehydrogenase [Gimesia panareensis]QDV15829.1 D-3-phosphoglycerate dehydrogenase [Gimesia panareensis]